MGLDMYLTKKPADLTFAQCNSAERYASFLKYNKEHPTEQRTFTQWAGKDAKIPDKDLLQRCLDNGGNLTEEVGYWRKANAIHEWFSQLNGGMSDCESFFVSKEDLIRLKELCELVISKSKMVDGAVRNGDTLIAGKWEPNYQRGKIIEDSSWAEELLPTKDGFFFGSTDYNEYYIYDLEHTVDIINHVLETTDFDKEEIYYSAWW